MARIEAVSDSITEERLALVAMDTPPAGLSTGERIAWQAERFEDRFGVPPVLLGHTTALEMVREAGGDRVQVLDTTQYPARAIGQIELTGHQNLHAPLPRRTGRLMRDWASDWKARFSSPAGAT